MTQDPVPRFEVLAAGTSTTIQDWPGRTGYWSVGVPPSGPMDDLSFRLGNRALGNPEGTAGLEITLAGPTLRFHTAATVMLTGAAGTILLDGRTAEPWVPLPVAAGSVLQLGAPVLGMRSYLLVRGGIEAPEVLGSAATFDLGRLGGLAGRTLQGGDVIGLGRDHPVGNRQPLPVPSGRRPDIGRDWQLGVLEGPYGAPDHVTADDVTAFLAANWTVQADPGRAGVRLAGPHPTWARRDGGSAGVHPSARHPTPYGVGAVSFDGDQPVVIGPDGPSLGGATSPATVISAHRWRLGQLRPGDTVRFVPVTALQADDLRRQPRGAVVAGRDPVVDGGVLLRLAATRARPKVTFRRAGDDNLLVDYGEQVVDLRLRMRVHALADAVARQVDDGGLIGLVDLTPGVRSLQLHVDPTEVRIEELLGVVRALDDALPPTRELTVPSRAVHLPLVFDDPSHPGELEVLARVNGLASVDDVRRVLFAAEHLVVGMGDSHLGGAVTTALDPRHRLVSGRDPRRRNPAGSVSVGAGYLSLHSLSSSGGTQPVGRTLPVWSTGPHRGPYEPGVPWLLRFFDRIRWFAVTAAELAGYDSRLADGTADLQITPGSFSMADHDRFIDDHTDSIAEFTHQQSSAFGADRMAQRRATAVARAQQPPRTVTEWRGPIDN